MPIKLSDDRAVPAITHPEDAIVRLTRTTICGTDLHILKWSGPTTPSAGRPTAGR